MAYVWGRRVSTDRMTNLEYTLTHGELNLKQKTETIYKGMLSSFYLLILQRDFQGVKDPKHQEKTGQKSRAHNWTVFSRAYIPIRMHRILAQELVFVLVIVLLIWDENSTEMKVGGRGA